MVDSYLGKKYELSSSEFFEDFMKAVGVNILQRKMGMVAVPVVDLSKEGDEYTISSNSKLKSFAIKFTPGIEFDQDTPDGRKLKATINIDGSTLHETQTNPDGQQITIERIFKPHELVMILKVASVVCTRTYKAIP